MSSKTTAQKGQALVEVLLLASLGVMVAGASLTVLRFGITRVWVELCAWAIWPTL